MLLEIKSETVHVAYTLTDKYIIYIYLSALHST